MINRIRDIRLQKGLTLADVAARCKPPTTAQTIGRLETGTRNLSLVWMNRIADALQVDPELLLKSETEEQPKIIAKLTENGAEALSAPRDAILPSFLAGDGKPMVVTVEGSTGEYRAGDQLWLREVDSKEQARLINRDVLVPRNADRLAFGRLVERDDERVVLLPLGTGQRQIVVDNPAWLAVAEMLVRQL